MGRDDTHPRGTVQPERAEPYEPPVAEDLDTAKGDVAAVSGPGAGSDMMDGSSG